MKYRELYQKGVETLKQAGIPEAELDARLLLEHICQTDRNVLLVHGDREIEEEQSGHYLEAIQIRKKRIPLQHITGKTEFMGLEFVVSRNVLIPRQDTEILVETALKHLHDGMKILDMCCGSGCILLSLLHYSNDCLGVGVDLSDEALQIAKENAKRLSLEARWIRSDLYTELDATKKFDLLVSNPPYIRTSEIENLMPEVKEYEPYMALDGREDGLFFYRELLKGAPAYLNRGAVVLFEIGCDQGVDVSDLMKRMNMIEVQIIKDYAGLDRVVSGVFLE